MKRLTFIAVLLTGLLPLQSFRQESLPAKEIKYGVWKTYNDFVNDNVTDLGAVTGRNTFEKESVTAKSTKYWGSVMPAFALQRNKYVPLKGTRVATRYANGMQYSFLIYPRPIGIFYDGNITLTYDANKDVTGCKIDGGAIMYASKGDGELISTHQRARLRAFFDDDPEIQKAYDNDDATVHSSTGSDHFLYFAKYAVKYNRKHNLVQIK